MACFMLSKAYPLFSFAQVLILYYIVNIHCWYEMPRLRMWKVLVQIPTALSKCAVFYSIHLFRVKPKLFFSPEDDQNILIELSSLKPTVLFTTTPTQLVIIIKHVTWCYWAILQKMILQGEKWTLYISLVFN